MTQPNALLEAALAFAARGWPVFPCNPKHKAPLLGRDKDSAGKDIPGSGGVSKASTDPEQIRAWWKRWPKALVAIATGHPTIDAGGLRLFVVDFDPREDSDTGEIWTLDRLKGETEAQVGCPLPPSLAAVSPSEGVHLYLLQPDDGPPINNRGNLPEHVDVRGLGGYVIAPPSVMGPNAIKGQAGLRYRWLRGDAEAPIALAPAELLAVLRDHSSKAAGVDRPAPARSLRPLADLGDVEAEAIRKYALAALDGECRAVRGAGSGHRNAQLNESALKIASLVAAGAIDETIARSSLEAAARDNPGRDDDRQLAATLESGWSAGINQPRDLSEIAAAARSRAERRSGPWSHGGAPGRPRPDPSAPPPPSSTANRQPSFRTGSGPDLDLDGGAGGDDDEARRARLKRLHRRCSLYPQTDYGNAERFVKRVGGRFRWCPALGWLAWDGRRWATQTAEKLVSIAVYRTVRAIQDEAKAMRESGRSDAPDPPRGALDELLDAKKGTMRSDKLAAWGRASENNSRLKCIADIAKPWLTVEPEELDANPFAINVLNGTIEVWRRVEEGERRVGYRFRPHDPADLITKLAPVEFDRDAACPEYDDFLALMQPEEPMRRFLHQWGGYSLTGDVSEQKLAHFHGGGRNGKSTLVDAWAAASGDYSDTVPIETFLDQGRQRRGGDATPDLAQLGGVRMLRTSEPEKDSKLGEALIKLVTGGEPMKVRHLNRDFFTLRPTFKLTISGNHKPAIKGTDDGIWRRMMLVPWSIQVARDEADKAEMRRKDPHAKFAPRWLDPDLKDRIIANELSGILNRLLAGLLDWLKNGLVQPEEVSAATRKYREQSDALGRFLVECTEPDPASRIQSSKLHAVFIAWAACSGENAWTQKGFTKAMHDAGYETKASNGMQWLGLRLIRDVHDFVDEQGRPIEQPAQPRMAGDTPPPPQEAPDDNDDLP